MDTLFYILGVQVWQDGSQYEGDFVSDKRHGKGEVRWSNKEVKKKDVKST